MPSSRQALRKGRFLLSYQSALTGEELLKSQVPVRKDSRQVEEMYDQTTVVASKALGTTMGRCGTITKYEPLSSYIESWRGSASEITYLIFSYGATTSSGMRAPSNSVRSVPRC